jgi:cysteine-S-conjugate beta-lyase
MDLDALDIGALRRRLGEKWATYPEDVLPAWVADMDFPVAEPIRRYLEQAVTGSDLGYPVNPTPQSLPTVFAERMLERFGWSVDPERVEVLTDVVQGLYISTLVYSQSGDGVITQLPIYPPFLHALRECGRRCDASPLVPGRERYEFDFDALRASIDDRTRILLLSNPQNPTGRAFSRAELEQLAELALSRDWTVVSDEIHSDLVYPDAAHVPFATLGPEVERRTVTLTSATKAFNIAGLRCTIAAFGCEELQDRFNSVQRHVRGGIGILGLEATRVAWQQCDGWLAVVLAYLRANRDHTAEFVRKHWPEVRHLPPEATYLAWLDCRALELPGGPYHFFLREARVALSNGPAFGEEYAGFVRLNFATSRPILTQILERMDTALRTHRRTASS